MTTPGMTVLEESTLAVASGDESAAIQAPTVSVGDLALPDVVALLHGDDRDLQAQAAARLADIGLHRPATL
ncbi:MAG: hypothetical protein WAW20_12990, partial [Anaerolineae bacterium]